MWFFRIIERSDGGWECRHGMTTIDTHAVVTDAINHMKAVASKQRPARLFLHRLDGTVHDLGEA